MAQDMTKTFLVLIVALVLQACGGSDFAPESEPLPAAGTSTPSIPVEPAPLPSIPVEPAPAPSVTVTPTQPSQQYYLVCTRNCAPYSCYTTELPTIEGSQAGGCGNWLNSCPSGTPGGGDVGTKYGTLPTTIPACK